MANDEDGSPPDDPQAWWERFQVLLDDQYVWPAEYTFKFIAPVDRLRELKALFGEIPLNTRRSRKGNYVSVTARVVMHSSEEVVALYKATKDIEGVISL